MPIWELTPTDPDDDNWRASTYKGRVVIRASDELIARQIAVLTFRIATKPEPGKDVPFCPWDYADLVECRQLEDSDYPDEGPEEILEPPEYDHEWRRVRDAMKRRY